MGADGDRSRSREEREKRERERGSGSVPDLAEAMRKAMLALDLPNRKDLEQLATKQDVAEVRGEVAGIKGKCEEQDARIAKLEQAIEEMRKIIRDQQAGTNAFDVDAAPPGPMAAAAARRTSAGGSAWGPAQPAARRVSNQERFFPTSIIVRGFAPYGCNPGKKLSKVDATTKQDELLDLLPTDLKRNFEKTPAYAVNHQLLLRCLVAEGPVSRQLCERASKAINLSIETGRFTISDAALKCVLEISPERKLLCRNYYAALDWLRTILDPATIDTLQFCNRSLKVYDQNNNLVGETPVGSVDWMWSERHCTALKMPMSGIGWEFLFDRVPAPGTPVLADGAAAAAAPGAEAGGSSMSD